MFNVAFDRSMGEFLSRYCIKHGVTPQQAIWHSTVLDVAGYYWNEARDSGMTRVDLRIGCGSSSVPIAELEKEREVWDVRE